MGIFFIYNLSTMKIKEFKFIRELKQINNQDLGIYFDTFGKYPPRTKFNQDKSIRPFIIFYSNGYYYYLICRSAKNHLGQIKNKFDSEVLIYGSKNSNVVPQYDSYIRTNQIFKISTTNLNQIVDFQSPKFINTKSLLESNDAYHQLVVKRIKERLLTYLSKIPPQVALTEVKLDKNELKAKPIYTCQRLLEIDKQKNNRSINEFEEILNKVNPTNLKIVNELFCKLYDTWKKDKIELSEKIIKRKEQLINLQNSKNKSLSEMAWEDDKKKEISKNNHKQKLKF